MERKIYNSYQEQISVIGVPWLPQQVNSYSCLPYSVWMILQYYKNLHPNELLKKNIPNLTVEEVYKICKTNKFLGTRLNQQLMEEFNKKIPALKFELKSNVNYTDLEKYRSKNCPCIIIYDCGFLISKVPTKVAHAGVVIGIDNNFIYLNNPWLGPETEINKTEIENAWEIEYNQVIFIEPNLQSNLQSEVFTENAEHTTV